MKLAAMMLPMSILLVALCGYVGCLALHVQPHAKEMILAGMIGTLGFGFGLVPVKLAAGSSQMTLVQAGLVATAVHLFACLVFAGCLALAGIGSPQALLLWTLPMYWTTLAALAYFVVRSIRSAPAGNTSQGNIT